MFYNGGERREVSIWVGRHKRNEQPEWRFSEPARGNRYTCAGVHLPLFRVVTVIQCVGIDSVS